MLRIGPDPSNNHVSAINVREDNKRIGIHKNPSGKYIFDISGSLNCKSLYVNDLHYQPGDAMWNVDNSNVSYTSGNVGIGTTSPGTTLDVSGIVQAGDAMISTWSENSIYAAFSHKNKNTLTGYALIQQNNGTTYLNSETGRALHLRIANNTKMIIASDGKVGIGTTSPASALHVAGAIDTTPNTGGVHMGMNSNDAALKLCDGASSSTGGTCYIDFTKATVTRRGRIQYAFADDSLRFQTATSATDVGSEKMRISSAGNVGIGTTSPTSTLHVGGQTATFETVSQASGIKFIPSSYIPGVEVGTINDNVTFIGNTPITSKDYIDEINAHSDATVITQDHSHFQISAGNAKQRSIIITTGEGIRNIQGWNTQTVSGSNTHSHISLQALGGNVGIGTTSPGKTLDISSDTGTTLRVETTGAATNFTTCPIIALKTTSHEANINLNSNDGALRFSVNDTNRMFLLPSGNVGIGTTSPNDPLEVNGAIRAGNSGFKIGSNVMALFRTSNNVQLDVYDDFIIKTGPVTVGGDPGAVDSMIIKSDGKVGIGTTSPSSALHVAGDRDTNPDTKGIHMGMNSTNDAAIEICAGGSATANHSYIDFTKENVDQRGRILYTFSDDSLSFRTAPNSTSTGTEKMRITSAGNVGIGTTSPSEHLTVQSAAGTDATFSVTTQNEGQDAILFLGTPNGASAAKKCAIIAEGGTNWSTNDLHFCLNSQLGSASLDANDSSHSATLADSRMVIQNNGFVGIGTTSPSELLDVKGTIFSGNAGNTTNIPGLKIRQRVASTGNDGSDYIQCGQFGDIGNNSSGTDGNKFIVKNNGNVGIGTTSPPAFFSVDHRFLMFTKDNASTSNIGGSNKIEIGDYKDRLSSSTLENFVIQGGDNGSQAFIFTAGGSFQASIRNIQGWDTLDSRDYTRHISLQALGGNVGIGTTTPFVNLSVNSGSGAPSSSGNIAGTLALHNSNSGPSLAFGLINQSPANTSVSWIQSAYVNSSNQATNLALYTGPSERMRITDTGNVGIGTNSPSHLLHLKSNIDATLFIEADADNTGGEDHLPMLLLHQDGGAFFHSFGGKETDPNNALKIETGKTTSGEKPSIVFLLNGSAGENSGTERMRIEPDGKVGIGTNDPTALLHLKSSGDVVLRLEADYENSGENDLPQLLMTQDGGLHFHSFSGVASSSGHSNDNSLRIETGSDTVGSDSGSNVGSICFATGGSSGFGSGTERMRIDETGNVGIGTSSPSSSLHIAGHSATFETVAQASGIKFIPSSYVNGSNLTQNDNVAFIANNPMTNSEYISEINDHSDFQTTAATSGFGHFQLAAGDSKQRSIILSAGRIGSYNFYNIQAWAAEAKIANNLSLQALGGNVGIGTTSPAQKLHVTQGDIQINNGKIFGTIDNYSRNGSTADNDMLVFNAHTSGAASFGSAKIVLRRDLGNFYGAEILGGLPTGTTSSPIDLEGSERFAINTVGNGTRTRTLSILSSGNVGIGMPNPNEKLDIYGYCRAINFISTSDDRVKHNETPLTNSLGLISQLRPKRYLKTQQMYDASLNITIDASGNYTDISENDVVTEEIGIIAQDVLSMDDLSFLVKPSLDPSGNETGPMGLDYQSLFVLSIQAIQEQQTMIQQLTSRIENIERQQTDS